MFLEALRLSVLSASLVVAGYATGQATERQVGTLTCTTIDVPEQATADVKVSCQFDASFGQDGNFVGKIVRMGPADLPAGKRVLVWSVLAPSTELGVSDLEGRYTGLTGGRPPGRLAGGKQAQIVLVPVTVTSQIGDAIVPTVLTLQFKPPRA